MIKRRVFWLLWLAAAAVLYFFENNTGTRIVLASSLLIPLLSILFAMLFTEHVRFELSVPERVHKGEIFTLVGSIQESWLLAACLPCASVCIENPLTGEMICSERLSFEREKSIRFKSDHCGSLVVRLQDRAVEDRFGLFRFSVQENASAERRVIVYPELFPVRIDHNNLSNGSEVNGSLSAGNGGGDLSSYSGIREYVPGDPVRQIHWKLSVKTDRLLIRECEKDTAAGLTLWLETSPEKLDPAKMDHAAEALLSVSHSLCESNDPHQVSWFDHAREEMEKMFVASETDFEQMEKALLSAKSGSGSHAVMRDYFESNVIVRFDPADEAASSMEPVAFPVR